MAPKQYHGDDTILVVGGLFVALFQFAWAILGLVFVGIRGLARYFRRR